MDACIKDCIRKLGKALNKKDTSEALWQSGKLKSRGFLVEDFLDDLVRLDLKDPSAYMAH